MVRLIIKKIIERLKLMPEILRVLCVVSILFGLIFFIVFLIRIFLDVEIEGFGYYIPYQVLLLGGIHLYIGVGIYFKNKIAMFIACILLFIEYPLLNLKTDLSYNGDLEMDLVSSVLWLVFFTLYYYLSPARSYFKSQ